MTSPHGILGGIRVRDHRGRRVRMRALRGATLTGFPNRALPREAGQRIEDRAGWTTRLSGYQQLGCAVVCAIAGSALLMGVAMVASFANWFPGVLLLQALAGLGLVLGTWAAIARWNQQRHADDAIAGFLAERRCPCCLYDLVGCQREQDGCGVCPECGAAWRRPPALPPADPV